MLEALRRQGCGKAADLYRQLHARDHAFVLSETGSIRGYALMEKSGGPDDVIAIAKFGTSPYPDSFNLFDRLGEAQENKHDTAAAIACYRRSLGLNPKNTNATAHLAVLTGNQSTAASGSRVHWYAPSVRAAENLVDFRCPFLADLCRLVYSRNRP